MKIVIDISESIIEHLKDGSFGARIEDRAALVNAVMNGTQLPKGHGRLIDADAFITKMEDASKRQKYKKLLINDCLTVDDVFKSIIESLLNKGLAESDSPTIIEADKTESEEV